MRDPDVRDKAHLSGPRVGTIAPSDVDGFFSRLRVGEAVALLDGSAVASREVRGHVGHAIAGQVVGARERRVIGAIAASHSRSREVRRVIGGQGAGRCFGSQGGAFGLAVPGAGGDRFAIGRLGAEVGLRGIDGELGVLDLLGSRFLVQKHFSVRHQRVDQLLTVCGEEVHGTPCMVVRPEGRNGHWVWSCVETRRLPASSRTLARMLAWNSKKVNGM